jgi:hypothetical protein
MDKPTLNPHPTQHYELTVTVDAPGSFDSIKGYASYKISNVECTPKNSFEGVHEIPEDVDHEITLTRVDGRTYKGYFYRDLLEDADYFGLGACHWDIEAIGPNFTTHGLTFDAAMMREDILADKTVTEYFRKKEYFDQSINDSNAGGALVSRTDDTPGEWFPVTMTAKKIKP